MGMLSPILRSVEGGRVSFWCPGCDEPHAIAVHPAPSAVWRYNEDPNKPTFSPSILMRSGHFVPGQEGRNCWCTYEERTGNTLPKGVGCSVCHSFVTDGRIQFLGDCTHALAGQTVDIPEWPK
jgi:hypothetical protein